ncbi:hypothetical protein [Methylobacterium brachiatum]|uniref:hypothetical protein n=1 Tax=Methylobacterium brachiatum TaxID=269660 RepID=UPI0013CF181E|nr:hypothetical protein [Methylobacterium brachiatum]
MDLISPTAGCLPAPPQLPMTLVPHQSALQLDAALSLCRDALARAEATSAGPACAVAARDGEIMVPGPEAAR